MNDPRLQVVIDAWATIPNEIRSAIATTAVAWMGNVLPSSDPPTIEHQPAARKPRERISHSPDFSSVRWVDGQVYSFTPKQRSVVSVLWQAMEDGTHFVGSGALLEAAEANCSRMRDLFRDSKAWGKIVVQGSLHGGSIDTYRLAPIGDEAEQ